MSSPTTESTPGLRLNLGSGQNPLEGFINVDQFGSPDLTWDLEQFPWPWEDNSTIEVVMNHVLEHLGTSTEAFLGVVRELHRICRPNAVIRITVPHPRSDEFVNDPTHLRPITPETWTLFSKRFNRQWKESNVANTPLGEYLDVDFDVVDVRFDLKNPWMRKFETGELSREQIIEAGTMYNNVVQQIYMEIKVIKPAGATL